MFEGSDGFSFGFAALEGLVVVVVALGSGFGDLGEGCDVDGFVELAVAAAVEVVALAVACRALLAKRAGSLVLAIMSAAMRGLIP